MWILLVIVGCSIKTNTIEDDNAQTNTSNETLSSGKDSIQKIKKFRVDSIDYDQFSGKFRQNVLTKLKKGETYSKQFDNGDLIESYKYLGAIKPDNNIYRVYYFFKKIMVADGFRGQSRIVFLGLKDLQSYPIEIYQVPTKLELGRLYFEEKSFYIDSLKEMLIIPDDGIIREKDFDSKIINELKMY